MLGGIKKKWEKKGEDNRIIDEKGIMKRRRIGKKNKIKKRMIDEEINRFIKWLLGKKRIKRIGKRKWLKKRNLGVGNFNKIEKILNKERIGRKKNLKKKERIGMK